MMPAARHATTAGLRSGGCELRGVRRLISGGTDEYGRSCGGYTEIRHGPHGRSGAGRSEPGRACDPAYGNVMPMLLPFPPPVTGWSTGVSTGLLTTVCTTPPAAVAAPPAIPDTVPTAVCTAPPAVEPTAEGAISAAGIPAPGVLAGMGTAAGTAGEALPVGTTDGSPRPVAVEPAVATGPLLAEAWVNRATDEAVWSGATVSERAPATTSATVCLPTPGCW